MKQFFFLFICCCFYLNNCFAQEPLDSIPRDSSFIKAVNETSLSKFRKKELIKAYLKGKIEDLNDIDTTWISPNYYNFTFMIQNTNTFESFSVASTSNATINRIDFSPDQILINVKVFSKKDINDRVAIRVSSIQEDGLKYTMVNSNQVYKDGEGNYIYYGKPNNYIKYNDSVYRIIGLINNKFKLVRFNESLEEYNENNNYITIRDFLRTFNNREVDESNMDLFDTWLKEYNNYWFSDGDVFIDNTINIEKLGNHISNEVLELGDYVLLSNGDGTINNPYEVKYGS